MLTDEQKNNHPIIFLNENCGCQLIINAVSAIFNRNYASALAMRNNSYGFTTVTSQRKQKGIQLLVIGLYGLNDIFLSLFSRKQIHGDLQKFFSALGGSFFELAFANRMILYSSFRNLSSLLPNFFIFFATDSEKAPILHRYHIL